MKSIQCLKQDLLQNEIITVSVKNSTNLSAYSYNPKTKIFSILFKKGTLYKYQNVNKEVVYRFLNTSMANGSIGKCFRENIMDKYTYTRFDNMGNNKYTIEI